MKDFFKYVLATVVGGLLLGVVSIFIGLMSIVGMLASESQTKSVSENSVLVMNMAGVIQDKTQPNILGKLTGENIAQLGLSDILSAVKKAKNNDDIKGIYIEAGLLQADYATLQEIRNAFLDFKKSGKWVIAYADDYSQGAYYLASAADKIYINPQGTLDWHGLAARPVFYKDLYAKFGVKYQVVKVGRYKSFTEQYTEEKMSDANREQVSAFLNGTWKDICQAVSESRKISVDSLNAYADRFMLLTDAKELLKYRMIDGLLYADQIKPEVCKRLGIEPDKDINQLSIADMANVKEGSSEGEQIAVYYAEGGIVQTSLSGTFSGGQEIVAQDVCKDLKELMEDDDVKAVVIRVNSHGGSSYASEQLWHQITELKKKKPVVVSMGGYAASGGYYMSCGADWIVAQPTTLTGSIGIFGAFPDMSGLLTEKLGVRFDEVKTNRNSAFSFIRTARPFNAEETALLQAYVNRGYTLFRKRVADGRKRSVEAIENVAQGHVWTGRDALRIGLVDQLGGLDEAIAKAAKLAKLDEYYTENYPEEADFIDQLFASVGRRSYLDDQLRAALGEYYQPFANMKKLNESDPIQAALPFSFSIR